jgi:phage shock protein PspC (stress-responsive transcriptional regulator)
LTGSVFRTVVVVNDDTTSADGGAPPEPPSASPTSTNGDNASLPPISTDDGSASLPPASTADWSMPPPLQPAPPLRWARVDDDRFIGGVCGGLARSLGLDATWLRIGAVVLWVLTGFALPAYIGLWIALPSTPAGPPTPTWRRAIGALFGLVAVGSMVDGADELRLSGDTDWRSGAPALIVALVVLAIVLLRGPREGQRRWPETMLTPRRTPSSSPTRDTNTVSASTMAPAAAPWAHDESIRQRATRVAHEQAASVEVSAHRLERRVEGWESERRQRASRRRRRRSPLGWVGLGLAAVAGSITWMVANGRSDQGQLAFGTATVVMGLTVLVSVVAGRAKWLILPAACTAALGAGASALDYANASITGSSNSRYLVVGSDELAASYDSGSGDLSLDIFDQQIPRAPRSAATSLTLGAGELQVIVPRTAAVTVVARVGAGAVELPGGTYGGYRRTVRWSRPATALPDGTLDPRTIVLDLSLGIGEISVIDSSWVDPIGPAKQPTLETTTTSRPPSNNQEIDS